jgi:hypothetical protein
MVMALVGSEAECDDLHLFLQRQHFSHRILNKVTIHTFCPRTDDDPAEFTQHHGILMLCSCTRIQFKVCNFLHECTNNCMYMEHPRGIESTFAVGGPCTSDAFPRHQGVLWLLCLCTGSPGHQLGQRGTSQPPTL